MPAAPPIVLNRDIDSGYWDYPVKEVTRRQNSYSCGILTGTNSDTATIAISASKFMHGLLVLTPSESLH